MRGTAKSEPEFLALFSPNQAVPKNHPLRNIKPIVDQLLSNLSPLLDEMYATEGRPSIPPERLLKAQLLIALYSVRSRNLFAEQLNYNLLFRWFLDMDLTEPGFDDSSFSKNQDRLLQHAVADQFFHEVVAHAHLQQYVSDDNFTVDGTLIEAWASLKSFRRQASADKPQAPGGDPGNPTVDFHGGKRCNQTTKVRPIPRRFSTRRAKARKASCVLAPTC